MNFRQELLEFAEWLLKDEHGEGHEEEIVDHYLRERLIADYSAATCPGGCDCSCCYGYPEHDCHCFTYPCNCGEGPERHGYASVTCE